MSQPVRLNLHFELECPECAVYPPDLIERYSDGDVVCAGCGLVLGSRIVASGAEWRSYGCDGDNNANARVGEPITMSPMSNQLDTSVCSRNERGRELDQIQGKSIAANSASLTEPMNEIDSMCAANFLPKLVSESAKEIYAVTHNHRQLNSQTKTAIAATSIFMACRREGVGRSFNEIWRMSKVKKVDLHKTYKVMEQFLRDNTSISVNASSSNMNKPPSADDFMPRFCSKLGLSQEVTKYAQAIAKASIEESILRGRSPVSIAASSIYYAAKRMHQHPPITLKLVADKTGSSIPTISACYKLLRENESKLFTYEQMLRLHPPL